MRRQAGFFDVDDRLKRLSDLGDQLEAFEAAVEFEAFRPELNAALTYSDGTQGGRPPFDPVMMFKILVIQTTNNLSDERAEFLINDRLSFMRFLGFGLSDRVPDARTIWLFRQKLTKAGAIGPLFERFDATLRQSGAIVSAVSNECCPYVVRNIVHSWERRKTLRPYQLISFQFVLNTQRGKHAITGRVQALAFERLKEKRGRPASSTASLQTILIALTTTLSTAASPHTRKCSRN
jgi:Transposase domain (DUF772)